MALPNLPNPINPQAEFAQAIGQLPELMQQQQLEQSRVQAAKFADAQPRIKMISDLISQDNSLASDPHYAQMMDGLYRNIGLPSPVRNGVIDINQLAGPSLSSIMTDHPQILDIAMSMVPQDRLGLFQMLGARVDPTSQFMTMPQTFDPTVSMKIVQQADSMLKNAMVTGDYENTLNFIKGVAGTLKRGGIIDPDVMIDGWKSNILTAARTKIMLQLQQAGMDDAHRQVYMHELGALDALASERWSAATLDKVKAITTVPLAESLIGLRGAESSAAMARAQASIAQAGKFQADTAQTIQDITTRAKFGGLRPADYNSAQKIINDGQHVQGTLSTDLGNLLLEQTAAHKLGGDTTQIDQAVAKVQQAQSQLHGNLNNMKYLLNRVTGTLGQHTSRPQDLTPEQEKVYSGYTPVQRRAVLNDPHVSKAKKDYLKAKYPDE